MTFGAGDFRVEVQTSREQNINPDGTKQVGVSEFARSTDPKYSKVDGVAKDWIVRIKDQAVQCTSFTYSAWTPDPCPANGQQTRTVVSALPAGCIGGSPVLTRTCIPTPPPPGPVKGLKVLP